MKIAKKWWNNVGGLLTRKGDKKSVSPHEIPDDDFDPETRLHSTSDCKKSYRHGVSSSTKENIGQSQEKFRGAIPEMKNGLRHRNLQYTEPKKISESQLKTRSSIYDRDQLAGPVMIHKRPLSMIPRQVQTDSYSNQNSVKFSDNQEARPRRSLRQLHIHQEENLSKGSFKSSPIVKAENTYKFERFNYSKSGNSFLFSNSSTINKNKVKQQRTTQAAQVIDLDADESDDSQEIIEVTPPPPRKSTTLRKPVEIDSESPIFDKPQKLKRYKGKVSNARELRDSDEGIYDAPKSSKINDKVLRNNLPETFNSKKKKEIFEKKREISCSEFSSKLNEIHDSSKRLKTKKSRSKESSCSTISHNEKNNNFVFPEIKINDEKRNSGPKIREDKHFSSSNFHVDNYLKRSNKPFHYFMDKNRVCLYNRTCLKFLHNYFNKIHDDTITNTYRDSNYNMSIAANKLRNMQNNIEANTARKFKPVAPENLEQYQEMEFIRNMKRFNELSEEPVVKKMCLITL